MTKENRLPVLKTSIFVLITILSLFSCTDKKTNQKNDAVAASEPSKIKVIFDTDANNELDDQHALAYLLFNGDTFEVPGITVNATYNGGELQGHYDEAERVLQLCNLKDTIPLLKGANGNFKDISDSFNPDDYDGKAGVDFLLESTKKDSVIIVAVGKLTNIALALKKDPSFAERTKIVWLGSNYPKPGEYNQDNDTIAMNYVLNSNIPFEMVTVRYGETLRYRCSECHTRRDQPNHARPRTRCQGGRYREARRRIYKFRGLFCQPVRTYF